jgi:hypothetical protein
MRLNRTEQNVPSDYADAKINRNERQSEKKKSDISSAEEADNGMHIDKLENEVECCRGKQ